jgi:hypothetical protein
VKISTVKEQGKRFETGRRVCFRFLRNTVSSPPVGKTFQQDLEPAGMFLLHAPRGRLRPPPGWITGECCFDSPLVVPLNSDPSAPIYNETSWKAQLARQFKAKGKRLSQKLRDAGYDAVVTTTLDSTGKPIDTREIVALVGGKCVRR